MITASEARAGRGECGGTTGAEYTFEVRFSLGFLLCASEAAMGSQSLAIYLQGCSVGADSSASSQRGELFPPSPPNTPISRLQPPQTPMSWLQPSTLPPSLPGQRYHFITFSFVAPAQTALGLAYLHRPTGRREIRSWGLGSCCIPSCLLFTVLWLGGPSKAWPLAEVRTGWWSPFPEPPLVSATHTPPSSSHPGFSAGRNAAGTAASGNEHPACGDVGRT